MEATSPATPESSSQTDSPPGVSADPAAGSSRPSRRRRLARLAVRMAVIYLLVCLGLILMETRLVFPGAYFDSKPFSDPARFTPENPLVGEIVTFPYFAVDGSEVRGRLLVRENAERVILFLHGNGIRAFDMDGWTQRLSDAMNATVLTAEYRGFQDEGFTPNEASTIEDAVSAMDALAKATGAPAQDITIYARSLGGGIAAGLVEVMQDRGAPPRSLILDRTFDSTVNVGADRYFWLPVRYLMRNRFESAERLKNYAGNVVQIHGTPDRIVPMKNGRALFDALTTPHKVWIEVPGLYHEQRISLDTLRNALAELNRLESENDPPH